MCVLMGVGVGVGVIERDRESLQRSVSDRECASTCQCVYVCRGFWCVCV